MALTIRSMDDKDAVSFFKCALNVRLLSRMTLRRLGVTLTQIFWLPMQRACSQYRIRLPISKLSSLTASKSPSPCESFCLGLMTKTLNK